MSVGKPIKDIQLVFRQRGWGDDVEFENIMDLLRNTASHINQYLRSPFDETINVHPAPIEDYVPRVLFRDSPNDPYIIQLTARNMDGLNMHTSLHMNIVMYFLTMDSWKTIKMGGFMKHYVSLHLYSHYDPWLNNGSQMLLFPQWIDYADKLDSYAENRLSNPNTQLLEGMSLQAWLLDEDMSRTSDYKTEVERNKQGLVAYQLLPLFEETPTGWNTIRNLPTSNGYLKDYLMDWYSLVDQEDKQFVARISNECGYSITSDN